MWAIYSFPKADCSPGPQGFDAFREDQSLGLSHKYRQVLFEEQAPFYYTTVLKEQQELIRDSYDLLVLEKALGAFTGLQHVQLLAVMVHKDIVLRNLASSYDNWEFVDCRWIPACKHATETLFLALGRGNSQATAFSSPTMSPQSLLLIGPQAWKTGMRTWSQLTYLEMTFDERPDRSYLDTSGTILTGHNDSMAAMFKRFFPVVKNLTTLYIRFTPGMPVRLPLEDVLHGHVWPKLRVLGIGSWMLRAEEIIHVVEQHKHTLSGFRLHEVYLLDGDLWSNVVTVLKEYTKGLEWVALQDISYEREYVRKQAYIETYSDTSSDSELLEDDLTFDALSARSRASNSSTSGTNTQPQGNDGEEDDVMYGNVFMTTNTNVGANNTWASNSSAIDVNSDYEGSTWSERDDESGEFDDLEDDGRRVSQAQRRHWERWIVGKNMHTGERYTRAL